MVSSGTTTAGLELRAVVDVDTYFGWKSVNIVLMRRFDKCSRDVKLRLFGLDFMTLHFGGLITISDVSIA